MPELNFKLNCIKIRELVKIWSRRYLSPLGKITVIKTFFLSNLNHLFLSLPSRTELWINQLNDTLFKFIWSNKPDKINRNTVTLGTKAGGLNMINVGLFIKYLKATWYLNLFQNHNLPLSGKKF